MDTQALIEGREENTEVRNQVNALPVYTTRITSISPDAKIKILASADVVAEDAKVESVRHDSFSSVLRLFDILLVLTRPISVTSLHRRNERSNLHVSRSRFLSLSTKLIAFGSLKLSLWPTLETRATT